MPFCLGKYMMLTTSFYNPRVKSNVTIHNDVTHQDSIDWINQGSSGAMTSKPLHTISGIWMEKFLSTTSQLWCTEYNIPNVAGTVQGIEFKLVMERYSRVEDLLIQLTLNGELIGENRASTINPTVANMYTADTFEPPVEAPGNDYTYGSTTDMWGTTGLTSADIADPTFGIVVSFKSNVAIPHRDLAYLYQLGIRITYA